MKLFLTSLFSILISIGCYSQQKSNNNLDDKLKKYDDFGWLRIDYMEKVFSATFYDDFKFHNSDDETNEIPYPPHTPFLKEDSKKFWWLREYDPEINASSIKIEDNRLKVHFYEKARTFIPLKYCPLILSEFNFDIIINIDKKSKSFYTGFFIGDKDFQKNGIQITFSKFGNKLVDQLVYETYEDGLLKKHEVIKDIYVESNFDNELRIKKEDDKTYVYINSRVVYEIETIDLKKHDNIGFIAGGADDYNEAIFKNIFVNIIAPNNLNKETANVSNVVKVKKNGSLFFVPVQINDVLKIDFIFDSGASDVSISPDVALTLIKTGTIKKEDWLEGAYYKFADGSIAKSKRFKLSSIKIGNKVIKNVTCSISNSIDAPMLLGQSVLSKFGKYTFDNIKQILILE